MEASEASTPSYTDWTSSRLEYRAPTDPMRAPSRAAEERRRGRQVPSGICLQDRSSSLRSSDLAV
jgi:hypothetical protein